MFVYVWLLQLIKLRGMNALPSEILPWQTHEADVVFTQAIPKLYTKAVLRSYTGYASWVNLPTFLCMENLTSSFNFSVNLTLIFI